MSDVSQSKVQLFQVVEAVFVEVEVQDFFVRRFKSNFKVLLALE